MSKKRIVGIELRETGGSQEAEREMGPTMGTEEKHDIHDVFTASLWLLHGKWTTGS